MSPPLSLLCSAVALFLCGFSPSTRYSSCERLLSRRKQENGVPRSYGRRRLNCVPCLVLHYPIHTRLPASRGPNNTFIMGGKIWSEAEERYFWRVAVSQSPKRVGIDLAKREKSWDRLAAEMQHAMGDSARRRYTGVMLCKYLLLFSLVSILLSSGFSSVILRFRS